LQTDNNPGLFPVVSWQLLYEIRGEVAGTPCLSEALSFFLFSLVSQEMRGPSIWQDAVRQSHGAAPV